MTIYLYKKTHNITGLKYLGKTTSRDPHSYPGSGKYWESHLNKHGKNYTTEILRECQSTEELKFWGEYYSSLWDVVQSEEWANLRVESGDGGVPSEFTKSLLRDSQKEKVNAGTHHLLGGKIQGNASRERVKNGTHNWIGSESNQKRIDEGTHNFSGMTREKHPKYDSTLYSFMNENTMEIVTMTKRNFIAEKLNDDIAQHSNITAMIKGRRKRVKGWVVITASEEGR